MTIPEPVNCDLTAGVGRVGGSDRTDPRLLGVGVRAGDRDRVAVLAESVTLLPPARVSVPGGDQLKRPVGVARQREVKAILRLDGLGVRLPRDRDRATVGIGGLRERDPIAACENDPCACGSGLPGGIAAAGSSGEPGPGRATGDRDRAAIQIGQLREGEVADPGQNHAAAGDSRSGRACSRGSRRRR